MNSLNNCLCVFVSKGIICQSEFRYHHIIKQISEIMYREKRNKANQLTDAARTSTFHFARIFISDAVRATHRIVLWG